MLINLETLDIEEVKNLLKTEGFPFEAVTEDDQLSIRWGGINEKEFDLYITLDKEKDSLRIYGMYVLSSDEIKDATKEQTMNAINFMNIGSNTTKYALVGKTFLTFEYGMLLFGSISSEYLMKTIDAIMDDISTLDVVFGKVFQIANSKKTKK